MSEKPQPTTLSQLDHLIKEVYQGHLNDQLNNNLVFFGRPEFNPPPYKPTFKEKWHDFWNHIPDFIDFLREYKYQTWRYWDKDAF